ncbi:MAG: hypothetical protein ACLS5Z_06465 [Clostridium fessum]
MEEGSITVSRLNQTVDFGKNDDCGGVILQMRFFPRGKCRVLDPPVSEPRFGTIFRSDRYWGGSTAAGFGDDGCREEYR